MAGKSVAKKGDNAVAVSEDNIPDFMKGKAGAGVEGVSQDSIEIPRIKLLQALSPEVQEGDFKPGEFYHTILEESFGSSITVVPVFVSQAYILWRPQDDGGGILARADDGVHWNIPDGEFTVNINKGQKQVTWSTAPTVAKSRLAEWGTFDPDDPNSQPAATKMINVAVVMPERPDIGPAVITLQRSSIKVGRKFVGKLKMSRAPSYGMMFDVMSINDTNSSNQGFKNFKFVGKGFVQDEDLFQQCEDTYKHFKNMGLNVKDLEDAQTDSDEGSAPVDTGNVDY